MRRRVLLLAALLALKAMLYLPVGAFALLGWRTCGRDALAAPTMVPVAGQLTDLTYSSRRGNGARVAYTYRYAGREHAGDRMVFCHGWSNGSTIDPYGSMRRQLAPLVGRPVTVWVDPARPANAVLFNYVPRAALIVLAAGVLFPTIVAVSLDRRWSRRLRQRFAATRGTTG